MIHRLMRTILDRKLSRATFAAMDKNSLLQQVFGCQGSVQRGASAIIDNRTKKSSTIVGHPYDLQSSRIATQCTARGRKASHRGTETWRKEMWVAHAFRATNLTSPNLSLIRSVLSVWRISDLIFSPLVTLDH